MAAQKKSTPQTPPAPEGFVPSVPEEPQEKSGVAVEGHYAGRQEAPTILPGGTYGDPLPDPLDRDSQ